MAPYVLCHRLKFPRNYGPVFPPSKAITAQNLFGRLRSGKSIIAFVCYYCHRIFTNQPAIQNHVRNQCEVGRHVLKCGMCDKIFTHNDIYKYVSHQQRKHTMKCSLCPKSFIWQKKLVQHRNSEHPEIKFFYECDLCRRSFKNRPKLLKHYKEHRRQEAAAEWKLKQYRCSYCRQACFGLKKLAAHYREHQTEIMLAEEEKNRLSTYDEMCKERKQIKQEKAELCRKKSEDKWIGTLPFEGRKLYVCYRCNIYFNECCDLMNHVKNHVEGPNVCMKCHLELSTSDELKIHQKLIHYHQCKRCCLSFVKKSHRKNHKTSCKGMGNGYKL